MIGNIANKFLSHEADREAELGHRLAAVLGESLVRINSHKRRKG